jgi:beta-barrel assembly-enhancing protease
MKTVIRIFSFILLLAFAFAVILLLVKLKPQTALSSTFAPAFQVMGTIPNNINTMLTKSMPIEEKDEKEFGEAIAVRFEASQDKDDPDYRYLKALVASMEKFKKKDFTYRVYTEPGVPNAYALPGGIIVVRKEMLNLLSSESELISILAHEMGHIEWGHCMASIKFELLSKKSSLENLGKAADMATDFFARYAYSKTQEEEADQYAFDLLLQSRYDPMAMSSAFSSLHKWLETKNLREDSGIADPIRDYFLSHPPLVLRIEKYNEKAKAWRMKNPEESRYKGEMNLKKRTPLSQTEIIAEWGK